MDRYYSLLYDFQGEHANELSCTKGELVSSKSSTQVQGWLSVTRRTGDLQSGMVPFSYLQPAAPPATSAVIHNVATDHGECPELVNFDHDAHAWFQAVDYDGNGKLCKREVLEVLKTVVPLGDSPVHKLERNIDALWPRWDVNASGFIDERELCDAKLGLLVYVRSAVLRRAGREPPPLTHQSRERWFQFWDEDGSGALSKLEVVRALIKTFGMASLNDQGAKLREMTDVVHAVWQVFDSDASGTIELQEFLQPDGLADTLVASLAHFQVR